MWKKIVFKIKFKIMMVDYALDAHTVALFPLKQKNFYLLTKAKILYKGFLLGCLFVQELNNNKIESQILYILALHQLHYNEIQM